MTYSTRLSNGVRSSSPKVDKDHIALLGSPSPTGHNQTYQEYSDYRHGDMVLMNENIFTLGWISSTGLIMVYWQ